MGLSVRARQSLLEDREFLVERLVAAQSIPTTPIGVGMEGVCLGTTVIPAVGALGRAGLHGARCAIQAARSSVQAGVYTMGTAVRSTVPLVRAPLMTVLARGEEVARTVRYPSLRLADAMAGEARLATTADSVSLRALAAESRSTSVSLRPAHAPASELQTKKIFDIRPQAVNGNSLAYVGDTHVYVIRDGEGKLWKVGESMRGVNKFGLSKRAQTQANKLRRVTGETFKTEIRRTFPTKAEARDYETNLIERYREMFGTDTLPGNKGNR